MPTRCRRDRVGEGVYVFATAPFGLILAPQWLGALYRLDYDHMRALEESVEDRRRHRLGERIHRSNLVGMGILPLQFLPGESADSLGPTGIDGISQPLRRRSRPAPRSASVPSPRMAARPRSARLCASIRRKNCCITATVASCSSCCANSWGAGACSGDATPPRSRSRQAGARGLGPG